MMFRVFFPNRPTPDHAPPGDPARRRPHTAGGLFALALVTGLASAQDETVTLGGDFGSFVSLGDARAMVQALSPDTVQPEPADENRVASEWIYFNNRGIRVRVCGDDGQVGTVNATVAPVTRRYVTETGVRVGDSLQAVEAAYGDRLEMQAGYEGVRFVDDERSAHRISFGFDGEGRMRWIALGALRDNGYTCGLPPD
jgi:hypothetical protein